VFRPDIRLEQDRSKLLYITALLSNNFIGGHTLGFRILHNHDITVARGTTDLSNNAPIGSRYDISYVGGVPDEVEIDGAFADWYGRELLNDPRGDVDVGNLDLVEYGVSATDSTISFFMRVDGEMGWGTPVPCTTDVYIPHPEQTQPGEPSGSGPPDVIRPRIGEDIAYIYLDSDNSTASGYSIGDIGADYLIEIKGRMGNVISKKLMSFSGTHSYDWSWWEEEIIEARVDTARLETRIVKSDAGLTDHYRILFQTSDWSHSNTDYSEQMISRGFPMLRGTRYTNDVIVCGAGTTPTIDGDYGTSEWSDANSVSNGDLTVYVKMDATNVYIAVTTTDTTEDNGDLCAVYFETDHANDGVDDSYDKRLRTRRFVGIWLDEWVTGTASGWQDPAVEPPGNHLIAQNLESGVGMEYEIQIPRTTLNDANNFDDDGERIGFAVIVQDAGSAYEEWPNGALNEPSSNSDSWGEMEIPEFTDIFLPVIFTVIFYIIWKKKKYSRVRKGTGIKVQEVI
jgi:hypothetical protein